MRSQKSFECVRLEPFPDVKLEIMDITELPFGDAVAVSDFSAVCFGMKLEFRATPSTADGDMRFPKNEIVIPRKRESISHMNETAQIRTHWIPAFAGMT